MAKFACISVLRFFTLCLMLVFVLALTADESDGQPPPSFYAVKPGSCAPLARLVCSNTCQRDSECPSSLKCCATACGGTVCARPVTARTSFAVKPGNCPLTPGGPWVCSSTCQYDTDCHKHLKCCRNRCGANTCSVPDPAQ